MAAYGSVEQLPALGGGSEAVPGGGGGGAGAGATAFGARDNDDDSDARCATLAQLRRLHTAERRAHKASVERLRRDSLRYTKSSVAGKAAKKRIAADIKTRRAELEERHTREVAAVKAYAAAQRERRRLAREHDAAEAAEREREAQHEAERAEATRVRIAELDAIQLPDELAARLAQLSFSFADGE